MNKRDYKYFDIAKSISRLSEYPKIHIGAIIVSNRNIIAAAFNKCKTHPLQKRFNIYRFDDTDSIDRCKGYIHAEMQCIVSSKRKDLTGSTIYVYREKLNGFKGNCRPCKACLKALIESGVKYICYTTDEGYVKEEITNGKFN